MAEALEKVKNDLGRDAVILNTRTLKRGGLWGMGARTLVEITAGRGGRSGPAAEPAPRGRPLAGAETRVPSRQGLTEELAGKPPRYPALEPYAAKSQSAGGPSSVGRSPSPRPVPNRLRPNPAGHAEFANLASGLQSEMNQIRLMVRELLSRPSAVSGRVHRGRDFTEAGPSAEASPETPAELQEYYTRLLQNAVAEEVAREVVDKARQRLADCRKRIREGIDGRVGDEQLDECVEKKLAELIPLVMRESIERMLPPPGPVELDPQRGRKVVALVGPTGVGKTTTIAKLAAQFKLRENRRVGLITTDTYRIAAVDQLRAYADIMSLPLEVVFTPDELVTAIGKLSDCDLILIDTSGRSHRDRERLVELRSFLDAARSATGPEGAGGSAEVGDQPESMEVHLLLSCACDPRQSFQVAERFSALGVDRAVFTKLDEAVGLGVVLNVASRLNLKLSYLTTGQDVPDDLEVGHRRRIAEMLVQGEGVESDSKEPETLTTSLVDQLA